MWDIFRMFSWCYFPHYDRSSPPWRWGHRTTSPQKYSRLWRTGKESMDLSVTGGLWASACTKCCTARLPSMQSPWWKPMGRSWTTRWAYRDWSWFCFVCVYNYYTLSSFNWSIWHTAHCCRGQKHNYSWLKHFALFLGIQFVLLKNELISSTSHGYPHIFCTGAVPVPAADNRRVGGRKGSDSSAHLQSRAPIGPERHWGLQAPPFLHWYSPTSHMLPCRLWLGCLFISVYISFVSDHTNMRRSVIKVVKFEMSL